MNRFLRIWILLTILLMMYSCSCGEPEESSGIAQSPDETGQLPPEGADGNLATLPVIDENGNVTDTDTGITPAAEPVGEDNQPLQENPAQPESLASLIARAEEYRRAGKREEAFAIYSRLVEDFADDKKHLEVVYYLNEKIASLDGVPRHVPGEELPESIANPVTLADYLRIGAGRQPNDETDIAGLQLIAAKFPETLWGHYAVFMLETGMVTSIGDPEAMQTASRRFIENRPDNPYVKWAYMYQIYNLAQSFSNDYTDTTAEAECREYLETVKNNYRNDELTLKAAAIIERILSGEIEAWDDLTTLSTEATNYYEAEYWQKLDAELTR